MSFKKCKKCEEELSIDLFRCRKKGNALYYESYCKDCEKIERSSWTRKNKDHVNKKNKEWRDNNKDKAKESSRSYYENNKEKIKEYQKKWRERQMPKRAIERKEVYINRCKQKYKDRFDFSNTDYIDSYKKIIVRCIKHDNTFLADPVYFLSDRCKGDLCSECRIIKHTHESFIHEASRKNPNIDFSITRYIDCHSEIEALCKKHGKFSKKPRLVLEKNNICPVCIKEAKNLGHFDLVTRYTNDPVKGSEPGVFYELKVTHKPSGIEFVKIGVTSYTSYQRYNRKKYKDFEFEVINEVFDTNLEVAKLEKEYKKNNKESKFYLPNYIDFEGRTELYKFNEEYQLKSSQVKIIRDSILEQQGGKCPLCKGYVIMPTLDHYHSKRQYGSGLVRGVLCNTCNRLAGVIENNLARNGIDYSDAPGVLLRIADYLENSREPYVHPSEKQKAPVLGKNSYNKLVKAIAGKQKIPKYNGKYTKALEKLFDKYKVEPTFKKSSTAKGEVEEEVQE